jgi:hypothetical protein
MARPADRAVRSIFAFLRSKAKDAASIPRANLISNDNFFSMKKELYVITGRINTK